MQQQSPAAAEVSASHDELRRACVENIRQACGRLDRNEISLSAATATNTHTIHRTAFGGGASGSSTAVMGQFRTFVDEYGAANCCPPAFIPGRSKPWPRPIAERLQRAAVNVRCGVFPQIARVWVIIDNQILLWNYNTDDVTTTIPAMPEAVVALHLAEPRRGVFLPTVQFVLVVATARSLHMVGITAADSGDLSGTAAATAAGGSGGSDVVVLELGEFTVQTPVALTCLTSHRRTGRVFAGATDGYIYEVIYSNVEGMLMRNKLTLVNRSIYFGGTAVVSTLSRAASALRQTWSKAPNTPLVDIVCTDDRAGGTLFALSQAGKIEARTVEEEDPYGALSTSAAMTADGATAEAPADAGAITFQCAVEHKEALTAYLQEPGRRVAGQQQQQGNQQQQQQQQPQPQQQQRPTIQPLISLQLSPPGRGGGSSSSSSGTVIAVDACGARYYYNSSTFYSSFCSASLELKLSRREAPLRFADGAESGSRRLRCCALGGDSGTAFCAVHESVSADDPLQQEDDVVVLSGPNLLPFAPNAGGGGATGGGVPIVVSTAASPSEVVSLFTTGNRVGIQRGGARGGGPPRNTTSGGGGLRVYAVSDCSHAQLSAAGKFQRHFVLVHTGGVTLITALRPVDIVHSALMAPASLRPMLMQRVNAVASPADVAYLMLQLLTTQGGGGNNNNTAVQTAFRTMVFSGSSVSASAAPSPQGGGAAAAAMQQAAAAAARFDSGKCAIFEDALLDCILSRGGAPDSTVSQAAFDILRTNLANPVSMAQNNNSNNNSNSRLANNNNNNNQGNINSGSAESSITVIFSPLSGGFVAAIAQAIMHIYKLSPVVVAQGPKNEKDRFNAHMQVAERSLQALLDVMGKLRTEGAWNHIEAATPFLRPSVQVQYDDSAVNIAHARSCGSAVMRSQTNSGNNSNNNNNNFGGSNHNMHGRNALVPPAPVILGAQDGHWLLTARMSALLRIADVARQIAHFWRRCCDSVAPAIVHGVSQRVGTSASIIDMLLRRDELTQPARALVRALLAEERNAAMPNFAVWADLLADFERSCPVLYGVSDSTESRATLDIHRLARAGTDNFADRSAAETTLLDLARQAHTLWKSGSLEQLVWQLHRTAGGCSVDAVVLLLRAAARLDASRTDGAVAAAMRAVVEGSAAAGDGVEQSLRDKLRCLECLHSLLEELRRSDEATFELLFESSNSSSSSGATTALVPPGWSIWEVEPQDRATHLSILAWLAAPRDDAEVSRRLRGHVTGAGAGGVGGSIAASRRIAGGGGQRTASALAALTQDGAPRHQQLPQQRLSASSPFVHDFFELQGTIGGGHNVVVPTATNIFGSISLETARYQWHTQRRHDLAVQTLTAFAQSPLESVSLDVRLQTRIEVLREAVQCARQGRIDVAHLSKTLQQLENQRRLLADIQRLPQSVFSMATGAAAANPLMINMRPEPGAAPRAAGASSKTSATLNAVIGKLSGGVLDSEDIFTIANQLPCGAGFEVQLAMLCTHAIDDATYFAAALDRAFAADSIYSPPEAARICLQYFRSSMMFPAETVVMYLEAFNAAAAYATGTTNSTATTFVPTVDLLLDAGISPTRAWEELLRAVKLAALLRAPGAAAAAAAQETKKLPSGNALRAYLASVRTPFAVASAAEALKRHLVVAKPGSAVARACVQELLQILHSASTTMPPPAQRQQQQQQMQVRQVQQVVVDPSVELSQKLLRQVVDTFSNE